MRAEEVIWIPKGAPKAGQILMADENGNTMWVDEDRTEQVAHSTSTIIDTVLSNKHRGELALLWSVVIFGFIVWLCFFKRIVR